jgi:hypothetical protein
MVVWVIAGVVMAYSLVVLFHYDQTMRRYPEYNCKSSHGDYAFSKLDREDVCLRSFDAEKLKSNMYLKFMTLPFIFLPSLGLVMLKRRERRDR